MFIQTKYARRLIMSSSKRQGRKIQRFFRSSKTRSMIDCLHYGFGLKWNVWEMDDEGYVIEVPGGSGPDTRYIPMVENAVRFVFRTFERDGRITIRGLEKSLQEDKDTQKQLEDYLPQILIM